jgi:parallel beta-helix repeat protein
VPLHHPTIQAAIDAAMDGDRITVSPGTYFENIDFRGKAIRVKARSGARTTIIDGGSAGSAVTFASGEGPASVLSGFMIRNGLADFDGGGIHIKNASPTIKYNTIIENRACTGAGISVNFGSPIIRGNLLTRNIQEGCIGGPGGSGVSIRGAARAQLLDNVITVNTMSSASGGGIALLAAGTPVIRGNIIQGNSVGDLGPTAGGGGISMVNQSDAVIVQNLIKANSAEYGGGIYWLVPSGAPGPFLVNNTIADNYSPQGSAIYADGFDKDSRLMNNIIVGYGGVDALFCGNFNDTNPPLIGTNDIFVPGGTAYAGICTDRTGMDGNISADPLFVSAIDNDYHLRSGSPAVDAGRNSVLRIPALDFDGGRRIQDGDSDGDARFDMGIDEMTASAAPVKLGRSSLLAGVQQRAIGGAALPAFAGPSVDLSGRKRGTDSQNRMTVYAYDAAGSVISRTTADGVSIMAP